MEILSTAAPFVALTAKTTVNTMTTAATQLVTIASTGASVTTTNAGLDSVASNSAGSGSNESVLIVLDKVVSPSMSNYTDILLQTSSTEPNITMITLKGAILLLIILLTITGNLLVLVAIFMNPNLRTTTNYFIVNLAIADLMLGASVLPFSATLELLDKQWYFGQIFCNVWAATDVLCCTASINSLCVISVDRYIGVTRPLSYSSIVTHRRAVTTCVVVWILSFIISVGPLFGWRDPPSPNNQYSCEVNKKTGYVIFSVLFSFYIPTLVILVVYQRIYRAATRQTEFLETGVKIVKSGAGSSESGELTLRVHQGHSKSASQQREFRDDGNPKMVTMGLQGRLAKFKRQKKAAKTLGIVVGVYFICWFPFFFILPLDTICSSCTTPPLLFDVIFWTGYFNSCLNPFIYATTSREYNRAFRTVLRCHWSLRGSARADAHNATDYQWSNSKTVTYTIRDSKSPQRQALNPGGGPPRLSSKRNMIKDVS
ncbi:alpha-1A adrenergic receptor-like isoform X2 [Varroa destructor]|uniref:G-protein coupled receptors family 1 profile domain-containing protein n=1 Tax=Varroa destructor TaxID=109461 RepID=A0A7M7K8G0_VARDE|nr:alpha-1A adrenergic receptor-like isoform X2 [Varroa destructor]